MTVHTFFAMAAMNDLLFLFGNDMDAILDVIESDQDVEDSFQEASDSVSTLKFEYSYHHIKQHSHFVHRRRILYGPNRLAISFILVLIVTRRSVV